MNELLSNIAALTAAVGPTGDERGVGDAAEALFSRFTTDVWRDRAGSVFARTGSGSPVVLVMAHMDELGMMVNKIEANGMLRICSVAGVDPRVLPASAVTVHAKQELTAVVGAVPPQLLGAEPGTAYKMEDLLVDTGLPADEVKALVRAGDMVTFAPEPPLLLKNGRIAGKTLDDRALVAAQAEALKAIAAQPIEGTLIFCASVQEEKSGFGAMAAAWNVKPDMALAVDTAHALTPDVKAPDGAQLDMLSLTRGGNVHPALYSALKELCIKNDIPYATDARLGKTGTDGADIQVARAGIPTAVISVPLRYMHTSVECLSLDTLNNCAKLLTEFARIAKEVKLCWND